MTSTIASFLSVISTLSCQFARKSILGTVSDEYTEIAAIYVGIWGWSVDQSETFQNTRADICYRYGSDDPIETIMKITRALGIVSISIGGVLMVICWSSLCYAIAKRKWGIIGVLFVICSMSESLKFLILISDLCYMEEDEINSPNDGENMIDLTKCDELSFGAFFTVGSAFCWLASAVLVSFVRETKDDEEDDQESAY